MACSWCEKREDFSYENKFFFFFFLKEEVLLPQTRQKKIQVIIVMPESILYIHNRFHHTTDFSAGEHLQLGSRTKGVPGLSLFQTTIESLIVCNDAALSRAGSRRNQQSPSIIQPPPTCLCVYRWESYTYSTEKERERDESS